MTRMLEVDVLIVGAGPVGLFLANECARRGLRWRLVESHPRLSEHSKALAIFPRTLEILDMAELVGPVLKVANRVTSAAVMTRDRTLARLPFAPAESVYPFIAMVPQNVTERLLAEQLRARGGDIELDTTFIAATQNRSRVRATLEHGGRCVTVDTAFLVGCDGAHSTTRHLLQLPFDGAEYEDRFMLADVETNDALPGDQLQLCPSTFGPVAIFPMSARRRRIVATVEQPEGDAPSLELVRRVLRDRAPSSLEVLALNWSSYFRVHRRQTPRMRSGRIFIAGDASHIHSPFGGQGMNTGLHDVWNLAWKLDLALNAGGTEALLDSYEAERVPAVREVIATTHAMTRALGSSSWLAQAVRDSVVPVVSRLAPFRHAFVERLSGLGASYAGSPIVVRSGVRYFRRSLRGGEGICRRFLLVCDPQADTAVLAMARSLAASLADVVELRLQPGEDLILVRPDGYVAHAARGHGSVAVLAEMRSLLERLCDGESPSRHEALPESA